MCPVLTVPLCYSFLGVSSVFSNIVLAKGMKYNLVVQMKYCIFQKMAQMQYAPLYLIIFLIASNVQVTNTQMQRLAVSVICR
jgi:hypothetical protein